MSAAATSRQHELQHQRMIQACQQQMQMMIARQQQLRRTDTSTPLLSQMNPMSGIVRSPYDGISIAHRTGLWIIGPKPPWFVPYEVAYIAGPISTVQSIVSSARSPACLHHGLALALEAGNIEVPSYLLSKGAPMAVRLHSVSSKHIQSSRPPSSSS